MNTTTNTRGVSEAMVERFKAAFAEHSAISPGYDGCIRAAIEAVLSAEPAAPCSLNEALVVIEAWANQGYTLSEDDVLRFRAIADRIAPEPAAHGKEWSRRMAALEAGQYVGAGAHGIEDRPAPPAQPAERCNGQFCEHCEPEHGCKPRKAAERVPEGLQGAIREAAEVLQMVADSGVKLPPNWRWPLLDELSGYAYMLMDASPAAPAEEGDGKEGVR